MEYPYVCTVYSVHTQPLENKRIKFLGSPMKWYVNNGRSSVGTTRFLNSQRLPICCFIISSTRARIILSTGQIPYPPSSVPFASHFKPAFPFLFPPNSLRFLLIPLQPCARDLIYSTRILSILAISICYRPTYVTIPMVSVS